MAASMPKPEGESVPLRRHRLLSAEQIQLEGATLFVLNARGVNRWWASVQPGQDDDGRRIPDAECEAAARSLMKGLRSAALVVDAIARQWDGCIYDDAPGERIDIGQAIRAAGAAGLEGPNWQPLATAPRCGRQFLVRDKSKRVAVVNHPPGCEIGEWTFMAGRWAGSSSKWMEPIEWCEIPA